MAAIARANAIESHGTQSPRREYGVRTVEARTSDSRTAGRNSPASAVTPPEGSMIAEIPEIAAWTTQRPSSTARSRLNSTCWREAAVSS